GPARTGGHVREARSSSAATRARRGMGAPGRVAVFPPRLRRRAAAEFFVLRRQSEARRVSSRRVPADADFSGAARRIRRPSNRRSLRGGAAERDALAPGRRSSADRQPAADMGGRGRFPGPERMSRLAARETPAAFGRRCIPAPPHRAEKRAVGAPAADSVAPPSNIPDIAPHRAQDARWGPRSAVVAPLRRGPHGADCAPWGGSAGRLATLGATLDFHHGLLVFMTALLWCAVAFGCGRSSPVQEMPGPPWFE